MTILSKKKNNPKNEEPSDNGGLSTTSSALPVSASALESTENHGLPCAPFSPTSNAQQHHLWPSQSSSSREEKHPPHNAANNPFDEMLDSVPSVGKRRHRASPHRTSRSKHRERVNSPPTCHLGPGQHPQQGVKSKPQASRPPPARPPTPSAGPSGAAYLDEASGYNSEDEYGMVAYLTEEEWAERDRRFEKRLRKKGWVIKQMGEDGACLFRAVADQVFGDQEMHSIVRNQCMDFLVLNKDHYKQYMTEDLDAYVARKRNDSVHGNHIELQALSEMFNRAIEIFCYSIEPINIFHGLAKPDNEPIRLSYHRGVHYNSIVDPYKATIGVGLGLPNFTPGLADTNLMKEAVRQSEECVIEQAMLEDKIMATDWEATDEVLTEQAARESYIQWLKDNEKRNKTMRASTATTSASVTSAENRPTKSGVNQRLKENSPEPHNRPVRSAIGNRNREPSPDIMGHSARPGMNPRHKDAFRCPPGCPCGTKQSYVPLPSCFFQNLSRSEDYNLEPEPGSSNLNRPWGSGLMGKVTKQKPCHSKQAAMGGSPMRSGSPEVSGHETHSVMHAPSGHHSPSTATTSHNLGPAGPCHSPNLLSSCKHFRYCVRDYSDEDEEEHALVNAPLDVVSPCEPGPSRGRNEMSMDFSKSCYNFLNQVPPEVLGLSGWEDDAKVLAEVLATSQEEYLDSLKKSTPKDSCETVDEEPSVSPEDNNPSNLYECS
ncbi:OTU domain-containing protein 5-B isoform X2 [Ischnura elegans]|uniref:OTU domain-containing protein 5-B isoform X2 n=1 Tax=Ischnura elegans TaxID=197161 RepID=UPI001ED87FB4|nr:OTU domain-containing protein 5-B isoform X2 [Ischnura elegans]